MADFSELVAPPNRGFIIMTLVGFLLILLAVVTGAAPDLIKSEESKVPPLLRIPLIGWLLALLGVGEVPILFLLGIYPFMVGLTGWSANLLWLSQTGFYPTLPPATWLIRSIGFLLARFLVGIMGHFQPLLKTQTVAEKLIPERFIGTKGQVLGVLGGGLLEVNVYDDWGKCSVQIYGLPWEKASDQTFAVGDRVYIVDLVAPRRYALVKADSNDELKALVGS
ncbi:MAG: hypothetical protein ACKO1W_15060 [Microcystaceae cyanobacterium]